MLMKADDYPKAKIYFLNGPSTRRLARPDHS
jgi:hypothetical protein